MLSNRDVSWIFKYLRMFNVTSNLFAHEKILENSFGNPDIVQNRRIWKLIPVWSKFKRREAECWAAKFAKFAREHSLNFGVLRRADRNERKRLHFRIYIIYITYLDFAKPSTHWTFSLCKIMPALVRHIPKVVFIVHFHFCKRILNFDQ